MDAATGIACVCVALITLVRGPSPGMLFCRVQPGFPKSAGAASMHRHASTKSCTGRLFGSDYAGNYLQMISWCSNWEKRWKYRHIPGPAYSFPLGNMATVRKKSMFRAYTDWQAQYGDTFKIFFVRRPVVVTTGESILNTAH